MGTRLKNLKVREISGVDDPANELPNWIVAKSASWKDDMENFEKAVGGLYDGIVSDEANLYFKDAPEEVVKARQTLALHLARDVEEEETEEPTSKSIGSRLRSLFAAGDDDLEKARKKGKNKDVPSGVPNQPIIGTPGATREDPDRVTPAMIASSNTDEEVQADEQEIVYPDNRVARTLTAPRERTGDEVGGVPNQPIVGTPAATREDPDRVTPAMVASSNTEEVDEIAPDKQEVHQPEEFRKAKEELAEVLNEQLEPLKEAIFGLADRVEHVEKAAATQHGIDGQDDFYGEPVSDIEKATRAAMNGRKVILTG